MNGIDGTPAKRRGDNEEGQGGGKCMVGFDFECMMSIYMGSSGVCILQHMAQGWPRCSACTIRGIDWGTMFGNNLRQESCLSERGSECEKRTKDFSPGQRLVLEASGVRRGGWACIKSRRGGGGGCPECANEGCRRVFLGLRCA